MKYNVFVVVVLKGLEAENSEHNKGFPVFYTVIGVIAFVVVR